MIQSDSIIELLSALADVQSELPTMPKSSQAYGYKYTDLDTITQTIKPILGKHGIGYMQSVGGLAESGLMLTTRIFNKKGEYIEDTAALPTITNAKNNAAQTLGMSITYMRRYSLCAMLGITSDEDVDANTNGAVQPQGSQPKQAQKPTPPKQPAKPKMKGGESTAAEKAEIKNLCESVYADNTPIFTKAEIVEFSKKRADTYTAKELIAVLKQTIADRRNNRNKPAPADLDEQALTKAQQPTFDTMQPAVGGKSDAEQAFDIF